MKIYETQNKNKTINQELLTNITNKLIMKPYKSFINQDTINLFFKKYYTLDFLKIQITNNNMYVFMMSNGLVYLKDTNFSIKNLNYILKEFKFNRF